MKKLFTPSFLLIAAATVAQDTIPDRWEENYRAAISYWPSEGQYTDMQGDPMIGLRYVSDGTYPTLLLHDASLVSMVVSVPDTTPGMASMKRLDFKPVGEGSAEVDPEGLMQGEQFRNFFLPHTMPDGVTNVWVQRGNV